MNNNNQNTINLIGQNDHKDFIELQAAIGIAQRGGSLFHGTAEHKKRLASDVNLLSAGEKRKLIFAEALFSN